MTAPIGHAYVEIVPDLRRFTSDLNNQLRSQTNGIRNQINNQVNNAFRGTSGAASQAGAAAGHSYTKSLLAGVAAIGGGMLAFGGLSRAFGFVTNAAIGFNSQMEQANIGFTTMLGSGQKAKAFLNELQAFAKSTPFDFPTLVKDSQLLLGMGINAKSVIPDLTALGDSVASVGGSTDTLNNTLLAFAQTSAKGKVDMGNLNQLLQGGVPNALRILAAHFHVTTGEMVTMISAGKVSSAEALPALVKGIEKGTSATAALGGMMDKQSHTFQGAMSNISDALQQSLAHAFQPFFAFVSAGANKLATWLSGPTFTRFSHMLTAGLLTTMHVLGGIFTQLGHLAMPFLTQLVSDFRTAWAILIPAFHRLWDAAVPAFKGLVAIVANLKAALWPLVKDALGALIHAWNLVVAALHEVAPMFQAIAGFIGDHKTLIQSLAVVILAGVVAWKAYTTALGINTLATKLLATWTGISASALEMLTLRQKLAMIWTVATTKAQAALNLVMEANPILLVVTALAALAVGFIYAYKHSQTFRDIVAAVWSKVKEYALDAWHVLDTIFHGLEAGWRAVWTGLQWAWRNIGQPVWDVIKAYIKIVYAIVGGYILLWVAAFKGLWTAAQWAWRNIGKPVWDAIKAVAQFTWRNVLQPIFGTIAAAWTTLWNGAQSIWRNVGQPIWAAIQVGVQGTWRFLRPIFQSIGRAWSGLWNGMKSAFGNIWGGIESAIITGINGIIHVINFFIRAIDWILDKLPGNLHINTISTIGSNSVSHSGTASNVQNFGFATGGVTGRRDGRPGLMGVLGGYTPGRDILRIPQYAFSGGEGILVPEATQGLGGAQGIRRINDYFMGRRGRRATHGGGLGMFADGGTVIGGALGTAGAIMGDIGSFFTSALSKGIGAVVGAIRRGAADVLLASLNAAESPVRGAIGLLPAHGIVHDLTQGGFNAIDHPIRQAILRFGGMARKQAIRGGIARAVGSIPTGQHLTLIRQALQLAGVMASGPNIADVNTIVGYESGWNPNAINLTDSNAAAGDPSRGLMQTIMTTFNAYRLRSLSPNIYNPLSNLVAGIRYAVSRYGSLGNVPGIVSLAHGGPYVGYETGSWSVPRDQVARVHQGEMILPRNIARYIRELVAGTVTIPQHYVPPAREFPHAHKEYEAVNVELRTTFRTLEGAWRGFMSTVANSSSRWRDFRGVLQGIIHDLHLHGDALRQIQQLEQNITKTVKDRADTQRQLTHAQDSLARLQASFRQRVGGIRSNVLGLFDVTSAGAGQTDRYGNPAAISAGTIIGQLGNTVARVRQFARKLRQLIREGVPRVFVTQLAQAGPAAMAQVDALASATPAQIATLRSDWHELGQAGTTLGTMSARYSYGNQIQTRRDEIRDLEKSLRRDDRNLVHAFRDALAGMAFQLDGDKLTLVVTQKQNHVTVKGPRR